METITKEEDKAFTIGFWLGIFVGFLLAFFAWFPFGHWASNSAWRAESVLKGHAHYETDKYGSPVWKWNEIKELEKHEK